MNTTLSIAFLAGLISFLSPCVLPLIPGYISYISGQSLGEIIEKKQNVFFKTILFSLGFSIVFISFGVGASFLGKVYSQYSEKGRSMFSKLTHTHTHRHIRFFNEPSFKQGHKLLGSAFSFPSELIGDP